MIRIIDKPACCGCGACASVCPKGCISLAADEEGFPYPQVAEEACLRCGLCERVCPLLHRPAQHPLLGVYGVKNKDDRVRLASSSGGCFTLLAQAVLAQGGCAYGAALDQDLTVRHIRVEEEAELPRLQGSKYVQSVLGGCFQEAASLLQAGRTVLFSGTPCQIAGLQGYLRRPYEKLYTVDVVCHGVPSPKVYRKHLAELARQVGEPVIAVRFRNKEEGWKQGRTLFYTAHHCLGDTKRRETYMRLFLNGLSTRPSCSDCAFNNKRSQADLTIADYWGVDKQFPAFDDDKGVTLAIINTAKGQALFDAVKGGAEVLATDFAKGAQYNLAVAAPMPVHPGRQRFFRDLEQHSLAEWASLLLD